MSRKRAGGGVENTEELNTVLLCLSFESKIKYISYTQEHTMVKYMYKANGLREEKICFTQRNCTDIYNNLDLQPRNLYHRSLNTL